MTRVCESLGYTVTTLDIDKNTHPTVCANVLDFDYKSHFKPGDFDVVWASPPCDTFSAARRSNIGRMVNNELMTSERIISDRETFGVPILQRTQETRYRVPTAKGLVHREPIHGVHEELHHRKACGI